MSLKHKNKRLIEFVQKLTASLGAGSFSVVDHWDADLSAVGIASAGNSGVLAYVSVNRESPGYFISFELPPAGVWAEHPYTPAGECYVDSFEQAAVLIARHILVRR